MHNALTVNKGKYTTICNI